MRYVLLLCAVLCGCEYETVNNYYGDGDAGINDAGEVIMPQSIFTHDSKLQGNATLTLQPGPVVVAGVLWPRVMETPARAGAQTLLDLQAADGLPHIVTVSLGNVGPLPTATFDAAALRPEVVAILDIGIGGVSFEVEIDFVQGTQLSFSCSRLQLHAVYRLIPGSAATPVAAPIPTILVGASIGTGAVAHGRQPQRTLASTGAMLPMANEAFYLPTFSKSCRVTGLPANITPTIFFLGRGGIGALLQQYAVAGTPSDDLPIANDAVYFMYQNTSLINSVERRTIFELAL
jgi:hypothetical protein